MLTNARRYQVTTKAAAVFVYGVIRYIDTYGKRRFTRFRVMTDGSRSVPTGGLVSCGTGNDTDDDAEIIAAGTQVPTRA